MTDLPGEPTSLPTRLGASLRFEPDDGPDAIDGRRAVVRGVPLPPTMRGATVRASVLTFVADAVAGVTVDRDPGCWTFTSDLTMRLRPRPTTGPIDGRATVLRRGRRSVTCSVWMTDDAGPVAHSTLGFAHVARRPGDPPSPVDDLVQLQRSWNRARPIDVPLRDAAGIDVLDPGRGVVEVAITDELRNPAGTMQGAIVALVAEVATEELVGHRLGGPALVTDLEIRYLAQARVGPVRTSTEPLGPEPDAPAVVHLTDTTTGRLVAHAVTRAVPLP